MEKKYFNDLLFLTRHSRAGYIFLYIEGIYILWKIFIDL